MTKVFLFKKKLRIILFVGEEKVATMTSKSQKYPRTWKQGKTKIQMNVYKFKQQTKNNLTFLHQNAAPGSRWMNQTIFSILYNQLNLNNCKGS